MPTEGLYEAHLMHFNGEETVMSIPGLRYEDGFISVPESITTANGKFFTLCKKVKALKYFEYKESHKPKVPFREDLH